MEEQTELSKKNTTDDIRARFLLAVDDTRLNGSEIGRRIKELSTQKLYNLRNDRNGIQQGIKVIAVWVHTQTVLHLIKYIAFRKVVAI